jgi:hypothetical protein
MLRRFQQRSLVRCSSSRDKKGIFQLHPDIPISIAEARDAYNCCAVSHDPLNYVNPSYLVFGVDGEMVEKYLDTVEYMESMYIRTKLATEQPKKIRIGPFTIYITMTTPDPPFQ